VLLAQEADLAHVLDNDSLVLETNHPLQKILAKVVFLLNHFGPPVHAQLLGGVTVC
jgi:hypothetical protein